MQPTFDNSVFLNCPFDEQYFALLRPMLFTVRYLGFFPRIALESRDSGQPRIVKIISLIASCRLAIHDISRMRAEKEGEIFRFNMPFELGLDIGCRTYKEGKWTLKKCLILDQEQYRYQKAISDLSNSDIASHHNQPSRLVACVRDWLVNEELDRESSATRIWFDYNDFWSFLLQTLRARQFSDDEIERLPINEFMRWIDAWMENNPRIA